MYFAFAVTDSDKQRIVLFGLIVSKIINGFNVSKQPFGHIKLRYCMHSTTKAIKTLCSILHKMISSLLLRLI